MFLVDLHGLLDLPALPYTAGWVVRAAENSCMDMVLHDFLFHILKIHAIYIILILH